MADSIYRDRGIIKWAPFDALVGFHSLLKELKYRLNRQEQPILSDDQYERLNQTLKIAIENHYFVSIHYYQDGYIQSIAGYIQKVDWINRKIILEGRFSISASHILEIEMIAVSNLDITS